MHAMTQAVTLITPSAVAMTTLSDDMLRKSWIGYGISGSSAPLAGVSVAVLTASLAALCIAS
jgi:hypothetical protein